MLLFLLVWTRFLSLYTHFLVKLGSLVMLDLDLLMLTVLTCLTFYEVVGRNSSVGTAIRYGLDGPGIESRWRRYFSYLFRPVLGRDVNHSQRPPSSTEVKERVRLYLYFLSRLSWPLLGRNLSLWGHLWRFNYSYS
jgi:hypothetical protein